MSELFVQVVNMSIAASWLVLAVVLLRALLRKAPKWIPVLLWGMVALRLICPVSIESVLSLIPSAETISPQALLETPEIHTGIPMLNSALNPIIQESTVTLAPEKSVNLLQWLVLIFSKVWVVGTVLLLAYTLFSYFRVCRRVGTAVWLRDNIYQSETVVSPFVLGVIKPKIYLPFKMTGQDMEHVIAHEQAHIHRRDHLWKPLGFLLLSLHWFNPVMWLAYILLCRDIELACDEKVVRELDTQQRADYSQALLACSVNRRLIAACPLAFGEVGVKDRVKSVLNYKKPAFWVIVVAMLASVAVAVCFLTNPKTPKWQSDNEGILCNSISAQCDNVVYEYMYGTLNRAYPYICVNWTNNTTDTLCYGDEFVLYKDGEVYEPKQAIGFDAILNGVQPGKSRSENYDLSAYDLEKGDYRLEKTFYFEYNPQKTYTAYISFSVDTVFSFIGKQYAGDKVVYESSIESYMIPDEAIPQFMVSEVSMELLTTGEDTLSSTWQTLGQLQQINLKKANFDDLFSFPIWDSGYSASLLRRNNLHAFSVCSPAGVWYYLLEQKNGDIYIAQSASETSNPRWVFKMRQVEGTTTQDITSLNVLQSKYPEFFDVPTDGGLTVYVWQMSKESYRCHLANTNIEALSDNSFAFTEGATLEEMRVILSFYHSVKREDITIQPVNNPLSSYHYEIDDAYREKIKQLFWKGIEEPRYNTMILSTATFDIDGDGKEELCELHPGPTSGVFTLSLYVWEQKAGESTLEYYNTYFLPVSLKETFVKTEDGFRLQTTTGGNPPLVTEYAFKVRDGNIVLTTNGKEADFWGDQSPNSPFCLYP